MKWMLALVLISSLCANAKATYEFVYIEDLIEQQVGQLIIETVYQQMGIEVNMLAQPASRSERSLNMGMLDGEVMRIYAYGEMNHNVIRVPTSYYTVETVAFIKKDRGITSITTDNLHLFSVARVRGIKHTQMVSKDLRNVAELTSSHQLIRFVHLGRSDIALTSRAEGLFTIRTQGFDDVIDIAEPLNTLPLFHYLHKKHADLVPLVDKKIRELKASGKLSEIISAAERQILGMELQ